MIGLALILLVIVAGIVWIDTRCTWCFRAPASRRCAFCRTWFCDPCWRRTRHGGDS